MCVSSSGFPSDRKKVRGGDLEAWRSVVKTCAMNASGTQSSSSPPALCAAVVDGAATANAQCVASACVSSIR